MTLEFIIRKFGYLAILIGTFFEGETILILGGFAAHRGFLSLPLVILYAFIGTLLGDQIYFFIGRKKGYAFLNKRPYLQARVEKFQRLLDRYSTLAVITFRFLYGLRTVGPFVIGISNISSIRFLILNIISAAIWAIAIGAIGYYFGQAMEIIIDDIKRFELWVILTGFLFLCIKLLHDFYKRRRASRT